jgi:hypothetical protein
VQERINSTNQVDWQTRNRRKVNIRKKMPGNTTCLSVLTLTVNGLCSANKGYRIASWIKK